MGKIPHIPEGLTNALKEGKCVLFAGAGLSVAAGYPSWSDLLLELNKRGEQKGYIADKKTKELADLITKPNKQLMAAQEISDEFGREHFLGELVDVFERAPKKPTELHRALLGLPFSLVITTNFDQLIENQFAALNSEIPKTYTHQDTADFADALWKGSFFVLKAHGDITRKTSIILTQKDYRTILYAAPGYRAVLSAIFTTKTILFMGVSLSDPETELLLGYLHDSFHGGGVYHYALVPRSEFNETVVNRWRKDYKVECLCYEETAGHPEVLEFTQALAAALKK
jgi:hypothetical protein